MGLGIGLGFGQKGAGGTSPFSPADLSQLLLWFDASDESSITDTGGAVSQWDDKSGNDWHVYNTSGGNKPTTNSNTLNGNNVIYCDSDFMFNNASTPGNTVSFPVVGGCPLRTICVIVPDFTFGNQRCSRVRCDSSNIAANEGIYNTGYSISGTYAVSYSKTTDPQLISAELTDTTSEAWRDGTSEGTNAFGPFAEETCYEFNLPFGGAGGWKGDIAEFIVYRDDSRSDVETYLANKWGIVI